MMENPVLFSEKQKFRQWWIWIILLTLNGFFLFGIYVQVIGGKQFGDKPMSDGGLIFSALMLLIITLLIARFQLETVLKKDGMYVRFFPFLFKFKFYPWKDISRIYIRQYSPIKEYGGWGIRFGIFGSGKAYNISGNYGIQIIFTDGKKLLLGTQMPQQWEDSLKNIKIMNSEGYIQQ